MARARRHRLSPAAAVFRSFAIGAGGWAARCARGALRGAVAGGLLATLMIGTHLRGAGESNVAEPGTPVRLVGSDLLGEAFSRVLADHARGDAGALAVTLAGSRLGIEALSHDRAEIGVILLGPGESPPPELGRSVPLAYGVVFVVVAAASPVRQVNFDQLRGIFAAEAAVKLTRWGELGAGGEWATRPVMPLAANARVSLGLFQQTVLGGGEWRAELSRVEDSPAALERVRGEPGVIALVRALPADASFVRALAVASQTRDVAFGPTPENVHAGDYPLRMTVWLVMRPGAVRVPLPLRQFLLSDRVAAALSAGEFMPVPVAVRARLAGELAR